jgi:putative copper export protein
MMMTETDLWQAVLFVHVLAVAFFVGGQLFIAAAVVPVERLNPDPDRLRATVRRFGVGSVVALAALLLTGIALASHYDLWSSETLRLKLIVVGLVIILALGHLRWPRARSVQAAILLGSLVAVWLGIELAH